MGVALADPASARKPDDAKDAGPDRPGDGEADADERGGEQTMPGGPGIEASHGDASVSR